MHVKDLFWGWKDLHITPNPSLAGEYLNECKRFFVHLSISNGEYLWGFVSLFLPPTYNPSGHQDYPRYM